VSKIVENVRFFKIGIPKRAGAKIDQHLKSSIESTVVKWVTQVNKVLQQEATEASAAEKHPGPMAEINYWRARLQNLESIYEQLQDERVHKMALVLSGTESAYYTSFTTFFKNVVTGKNKTRCLLPNKI